MSHIHILVYKLSFDSADDIQGEQGDHVRHSLIQKRIYRFMN